MKAEALNLCDFRNIAKASLHFTDGVNLLYGDNAQGKTNVLEAIYLFARGKSFRSASDGEMARFGCEGFSAELSFTDKNRRQELLYRCCKKERRRERNGIPSNKLSDFLGHFRAVLFCPEHLSLVKGGPNERRAFLNIAIAQNDTLYYSVYAAYNRLLENRNCLLKNAAKGLYFDIEELAAWSQKMAQCAAKICIERRKYIAALQYYAENMQLCLSDGKEKLTLKYECDVSDEIIEEKEIAAHYYRLLTENVTREIALGYSLYGIHRDDFDLEINGISARTFASQGQQRSAVLSLKLAEGEVSAELNGEYPVFLFDDVLSELDESRRRFVLSGYGVCSQNAADGGNGVDKSRPPVIPNRNPAVKAGSAQMIITACDAASFAYAAHNRICVHGGVYEGTTPESRTQESRTQGTF